MSSYSVFALAALLCNVASTGAFLIQQPLLAPRNAVPSTGGFLNTPPQQRRTKSLSLLNAGENSALLEEIKSMRVAALKEELVSLGVSTKDAFEKEELVQRLYQARQEMPNNGDAGAAGASPSTPEQNQQQTQQTTSATPSIQVLATPLYLTSLDAGTRIAATNGAEIAVEAKDHPYPSIQIQVTPPNGDTEFALNLLLDTACSGIVLRPSVVKEHNLPELSTPVTMTGAGGVATNTGLTQLELFKLEDQSFGPLPAAVQDIGALPQALDGIIGLSFLNQFEGAEMDFRRGKLFLFPKGQLPPLPQELSVVAEGIMSLVPKLSIYVVDVLLGGRGPVKMLVDSGASDTFLNWKGVDDLGLSKDSKFMAKLPSPMGAVGSDAVAMELTHRINISSNLNFGKGEKAGLSLKDHRRLSIDIGDIAILESLRGDGVGGILGIDAFMRCDSVRMTFQGTRIIQFLLNQNEEANPSQQQAQAPTSPKQTPTKNSQAPTSQKKAPTSARAQARAANARDRDRAGPSGQAQVTVPGYPAPDQQRSTPPAPKGRGPKGGPEYMNDLIVPVDSM